MLLGPWTGAAGLPVWRYCSANLQLWAVTECTFWGFLTFWGHLSGTGIQTFLLSLNIRHVGKLRKYRLTGVGENLLNEKEKKETYTD